MPGTDYPHEEVEHRDRTGRMAPADTLEQRLERRTAAVASTVVEEGRMDLVVGRESAVEEKDRRTEAGHRRMVVAARRIEVDRMAVE